MGEFKILPDDAVSDLQALSESNLPHVVVSATIARDAGARVGGALVDATPTLLMEGEPCRLTPRASPARTPDAQQTHATQGWTLVMRRDIVLPVGALVLVRGQDRATSQQWERSVRVVDSQSVRLVTSCAAFAVVTAGPESPRKA